MPAGTQVIACSATISKPAKIFFADAQNVVMPAEDILKKRITHWAIYAESRDKIETLRKFLAAENPKKSLIFTSRADQAENIYNKLTYKKIECLCLHAKSEKLERKAAIDRFRSGKCEILITSDLAARGLDIPNITHIIQMDLPDDEDFFVHRSGRTARAGKTGINVVIGDRYEMQHFAALEKKLGIVVYPKEIRNKKIVAPLAEEISEE
jgi:ATP-dependent rRNA helicase RRP3